MWSLMALVMNQTVILPWQPNPEWQIVSIQLKAGPEFTDEVAEKNIKLALALALKTFGIS